MDSFIQSEIKDFYSRAQLQEPKIPNPFRHRLNLTWAKKIEIALCFVFIFPLRLPVALVIITLIIFVSNATIFGCDPNDFRTPLSPLRRKMKYILRFLMRALFFVMGFHWVRVKGKQATPQEAPVYVYGPHSSFLDLLMSSVQEMTPCALSRIENFRNPFLGPLFMATESISVRRDSPKSRLQTIEEVKYRTITTRGQWPHVGVFPEGTCTNRQALISFKAGAFIPGCPVQPICIKYKSIPDVYTWVNDGPSGFQLLMFVMCQLHHDAEIEFLPVWEPNTEEIENPKLFAERVRASMARCLGIATTKHCYEDVILMREGANLGLPEDAAIVEYIAVSSKLGMNLEYMKARLGMFAAIDTNRDGVFTITDFARYYRLPICTPLKHLFAALDPNDTGRVTFRQYIIGTACLANIGTHKNMAQDALMLLQKCSKTKNSLSSLVDQQTVDGLLNSVDNMFRDDYNVRSRNEELQAFFNCHPEFVVLLALLGSSGKGQAEK